MLDWLWISYARIPFGYMKPSSPRNDLATDNRRVAIGDVSADLSSLVSLASSHANDDSPATEGLPLSALARHLPLLYLALHDPTFRPARPGCVVCVSCGIGGR
jgi:hypothetical protein